MGSAAFMVGGGILHHPNTWTTSFKKRSSKYSIHENKMSHLPSFVKETKTQQYMAAHRDPEFFRRKRIPIVIGDDQTKVLEGTNGEFIQLECGGFEVEGQGAVGFKFVLDDEVEEVQFRFDPAKGEEGSANPILHTISNKRGWIVRDLTTNEVLATAWKDRGLPLLNPGRNETFWMSFDKENLILRGGTGYMITALQLFEKRFESPTRNPSPEAKAKYLKNYGKLSRYSMYKPDCVIKDGKHVELIKSKYPIYKDLPPIVKDHDKITLEDLDSRTAISIKELSPECQRLYENVAGANIKINPPDFPDFAQAIDYSINHGICKCTLEKKAQGEFNKPGSTVYDANETYLRITLGSNMGDSPGIPYVMEIWPAGCYSPIHDHSQANAIIKVLHGSLTTRYFESLDRAQQQEEQSDHHHFDFFHKKKEKVEPYAEAVVSEGDVTWLDDRQFQTHQLFNHNIDGTACITIQCYMYNDKDNSHYENFDFIGSDNQIQPFVPNSDWDYDCFKKLLKKEFSDYKKRALPKADLRTKPPEEKKENCDKLECAQDKYQ